MDGYKKKVKILSKKKNNLINLCFVLAYGERRKRRFYTNMWNKKFIFFLRSQILAGFYRIGGKGA